MGLEKEHCDSRSPFELFLKILFSNFRLASYVIKARRRKEELNAGVTSTSAKKWNGQLVSKQRSISQIKVSVEEKVRIDVQAIFRGSVGQCVFIHRGLHAFRLEVSWCWMTIFSLFSLGGRLVFVGWKVVFLLPSFLLCFKITNRSQTTTSTKTNRKVRHRLLASFRLYLLVATEDCAILATTVACLVDNTLLI